MGQLFGCLFGKDVDVGGVGVFVRLQTHFDDLFFRVEVSWAFVGFDYAEDHSADFVVNSHCFNISGTVI